MMLFVAVVVVMLAVAIAFVLWPLLTKGGIKGAERGALNVMLFKDRSSELELERDDGSLSDAEFEQARRELQRDLLVNVDPDSVQRESSKGGGWLPWVLALIVPVAALSFYLPLGSTDLVGAKAPAPQQADFDMPELDQALAKLQQRLKENPDSLDAWMMLGRTLNALSRYDEAADAYARAIRAVGEENALLLGRAQALAMAGGNRLSGEPIELVRRVLSRDSTHPEALWLSGMHAFEQGDYKKAIDRWLQVKAQVEENGELSETVNSAIAEARARLDRTPPAEAEAAPAASQTELQVEVVIAPELADRIQPDDTLFVFARAPGSRMPVAAERRKAAELPLSIGLSDSASMADQPLSDFEQLEIVARVSKSGTVGAESGDLEGSTTTTSGKRVAITIDHIVP